jgi:hypothetical protein
MGVLFHDRGRRGLSVVVGPKDKVLVFALQSRGVDVDNIPTLQQHFLKTNGPDVNINALNQTVIEHCPFCGITLSDWVDHNRAEAQELASYCRTLWSPEGW